MSQKNYKALRKVFKSDENPEGYKRFKKALRGSDALARKKTFQMVHKIVKSGKPVHVSLKEEHAL